MIRLPPTSTLFPYTSSSDLVTNSAKTTLLRPLTWYRQALLNVALSQFMCPLHSIGQTQTSHCSAWRNLKQTLSRQSDSAKQSNRSEEHTSELQSRGHLVCRLLLEKK